MSRDRPVKKISDPLSSMLLNRRTCRKKHSMGEVSLEYVFNTNCRKRKTLMGYKIKSADFQRVGLSLINLLKIRFSKYLDAKIPRAIWGTLGWER